MTPVSTPLQRAKDKVAAAQKAEKPVISQWNVAKHFLDDRRRWVCRVAGVLATACAAWAGVYEPITTNPSFFTQYNIPPVVEVLGVWGLASLAANWAINIAINPPDLKKAALLANQGRVYRPSRGKRVLKGAVISALALTGVKMIAPSLEIPSSAHISIAASNVDSSISKTVDFTVKRLGGHPAHASNLSDETSQQPAGADRSDSAASKFFVQRHDPS